MDSVKTDYFFQKQRMNFTVIYLNVLHLAT